MCLNDKLNHLVTYTLHAACCLHMKRCVLMSIGLVCTLVLNSVTNFAKISSVVSLKFTFSLPFLYFFFFYSPSGQVFLLRQALCRFNSQNSTLAELHLSLHQVALSFEHSMKQVTCPMRINWFYQSKFVYWQCIHILLKRIHVHFALIQVQIPNSFHVDTKASVILAHCNVNRVHCVDVPSKNDEL